MTQEHKALEYVAGLIDAEGYFRLKKTPNIKTPLGAEFKIEMTSKKCMEFVSKVLSIPLSFAESRGENRKPTYIVKCGKSGELPNLITKILPFLNEKRKQCEIINEYINLSVYEQVKRKYEFYDMFLKNRYFSYPDIKMTNSYLAGLMDGDGILSITKQKSSNLYLILALEQCNKPIVEYLHKKYGGSFQTRKPRIEGKHRETYVWTSKHDGARQMINSCKPYSIEKYDKYCLFEQALDLKDEIENYRKKRTEEILTNYKIK